jgi:hypothetical protein
MLWHWEKIQKYLILFSQENEFQQLNPGLLLAIYLQLVVFAPAFNLYCATVISYKSKELLNLVIMYTLLH